MTFYESVKVVRQGEQRQTHPVGARTYGTTAESSSARTPLLDPLLGCPSTIVDTDHSFGASRHVRDDEAHPREQLSPIATPPWPPPTERGALSPQWRGTRRRQRRTRSMVHGKNRVPYRVDQRLTGFTRDFPYCESSGSKSSPNEIVASYSGLQGQSISGLSDKGCDSCRGPCFLSVFVVFRLPANGVKAHGRQSDSLERSPSWQDRGGILPQLGAGDNRPIRSNTP